MHILILVFALTFALAPIDALTQLVSFSAPPGEPGYVACSASTFMKGEQCDLMGDGTIECDLRQWRCSLGSVNVKCTYPNKVEDFYIFTKVRGYIAVEYTTSAAGSVLCGISDRPGSVRDIYYCGSMKLNFTIDCTRVESEPLPEETQTRKPGPVNSIQVIEHANHGFYFCDTESENCVFQDDGTSNYWVCPFDPYYPGDYFNIICLLPQDETHNETDLYRLYIPNNPPQLNPQVLQLVESMTSSYIVALNFDSRSKTYKGSKADLALSSNTESTEESTTQEIQKTSQQVTFLISSTMSYAFLDCYGANVMCTKTSIITNISCSFPVNNQNVLACQPVEKSQPVQYFIISNVEDKTTMVQQVVDNSRAINLCGIAKVHVYPQSGEGTLFQCPGVTIMASLSSASS